jgi:A/G-specific adenine glycosylase
MPQKRPKTLDPAQSLLRWYDGNGRDLPWRKRDGSPPDPYHVWLSEIMLQQTTVAAVIPYFHKFLTRWPSVQSLAGADLDQVLAEWAGLGYYARARNLHKCAKVVAARPNASFPDTEDNLRTLPGIGRYTAAAIAAIAFNRHAAVVDGNIERVVARLRRIETPLPKAKPEITAAVAEMTPYDRPGDFAQAMMDLGAKICSPRSPNCDACPWEGVCLARQDGVQASLPRKLPKPAKPAKRGAAFVVMSSANRILLRRRPESGLLGGMYEPPGTEWGVDDPGSEAAPLQAKFQPAGEIRHSFSHFDLTLRVFVASGVPETAAPGVWAGLNELEAFALPNVMRKVIACALDSETVVGRQRNRKSA